jgi:hypothetical protein
MPQLQQYVGGRRQERGALRDYRRRQMGRDRTNPVDVIDEMFIVDVVSLEWEVLRWRRLKSSLMRTHAVNALEQFLGTSLDYDRYEKLFEEDLTEILQDNLKDQSEVMRRHWHANVPKMNRTPTTRSIRFSPLSIWTSTLS